MTDILENPHEVELTVKFEDGQQITSIISWDIIKSLYKLHKVSAVDESYKITLSNYKKESSNE